MLRISVVGIATYPLLAWRRCVLVSACGQPFVVWWLGVDESAEDVPCLVLNVLCSGPQSPLPLELVNVPAYSAAYVVTCSMRFCSFLLCR